MRTHAPPLLAATALLLALVLPACALNLSDGDDDPDGSTRGDGTTQSRNFETLRAQLDDLRIERVPGDAYNITDAGRRFFWSTNSFGGGLKSYDAVADNGDTSYIVDSNAFQVYDVSADLVVMTDRFSSNVDFSVIPADGSPGLYELTATSALNNRVVFDVHNDTIVYLSEVDGVDTLFNWEPTRGNTPTEELTPSTLGWASGDIATLHLHGNRIILADDTLIAHVDRFNKTLKPILNDGTDIQVLDLGERLVIFLSGGRILAYDLENPTFFDVDQALRDHDPLFGDVPDAHIPTATGFSAAVFQTTVVYVGENGLFAYDPATGTLTTLNLEAPGSPREEFRDARVTSDGTVFFDTLFSESNSLGSKGPLYQLPSSLLAP